MTFFKLLLLFILVPLAELRLLLWVAAHIGGWPTVALVLLTGIVGAHLASYQGREVLLAIRKDLEAGRLPAEHVLSGVLVLLGAAFLVTPGVLTDLVGLFLMIPGNRRLLLPWLRRWFQAHSTIRVHTPGVPGARGGAGGGPQMDVSAATQGMQEARVVEEDGGGGVEGDGEEREETGSRPEA